MNFVLEPWHWFVFGILLILSELVLPAFAALWFGFAALVVCILLWFFPNMSFPLQLLLWGILSIACTVLWFKFIKPLSTDKTKAGLSREATIGQVGMVIRTNMENNLIKVRFTLPVLGDDEWTCRTESPVNIGDRVQVIDILGNELLVRPYSTAL